MAHSQSACGCLSVCMADRISMLRLAIRTELLRSACPSLFALTSCLPLRCFLHPSRPLSSSSWRPGSKKPFAAANPDEEDEEEIAARKAHEAREAAWKAEQAAQEQRKRNEEARKRDTSSSSSSSSGTEEPSILDQLHLSARAAPRRPARPAEADPDGIPSMVAEPAPAPGSPLPDLKTQLRAFFLLCHPDFFESHPSQKETNAASLALLSDFLDALRGRASRQPNDKHKTAKVQFWLRKKTAEGAVEPTGDAAFYSVSTTLVLGPGSKGAAASQQQLYASLSSLFKQAGIRNATYWRWGDEYEDVAGADSAAAADGQPASAARKDPSESVGFEDPLFRHTMAADSSGSPAAAGGSLHTFLRAERARAHHLEYASRPARHDFLLRMANLRLQGVRVVFESSGGGAELDQAAQRAVINIFESTLRKSRYFKPRPITSEPFAEAAAAQAAQRAPPTPWGHSAGSATDTDGGFEPQQPSVPFSQSVKMPGGFAGIFQQIKQHAIKEEEQQGLGEAAKAEATEDSAAASSSAASSAAPDSSFESRRSPFSRVASVFSSDPSVDRCHVDGRGRLVFSLHVPASAWLAFIDSSPLLIDAAVATQRNYRGLKTLERQAADAIGVFDLFAETTLLQGGPVGAYKPLYAPQPDRVIPDLSLGSSPSPAYQSFLSRLHSESHQLHSLRTTVKDLSEISMRVFVPPVTTPAADSLSGPASVADVAALFSVDPVFGLLLVPLSASVADLKCALLDRGTECVAIRRRQLEDVTTLHDAMLHAKRHLKLRGLTQSPTVSRDQMFECVQRFSRLFGPIRDLLQATSIHVSSEFELREEDGTLVIPWNWS